MILTYDSRLYISDWLKLSCSLVTMQLVAFCIVLLCYRSVAASVLVVPATSQESTAAAQDTSKTIAKPYMHYFHVESDIIYRYATTLATTRIENPAAVAQEVFFTAVLPETAFISGFNMEVDGKVYKAYVKEKEEAKKEYDNAVQHGQTAAQVALTARDSNRFTVSVNIEPHKEVIFNLTYEELLSRRLRRYTNVINLDPGQIVSDFSVIVRIEESSNILSLKVPALKVSEEMNVDGTTNALADIEMTSPTTAVVKFTPSLNQQKNVTKDGLKGQFIVEYDVEMTSKGGQVLVNDGYFVHFFSPENLRPLRKHVSFVLDLSGSMSGRPIEQLRQAMLTILDDLNEGDLFSIVLFSQSAQVWDPTITDDEMDERLALVGSYLNNQEGFPLPIPTETVIVEVTNKNIQKAKALVKKLQAVAATDIYDGLMLALNIAKLNSKELQGKKGQKPEPIIVFLTDGLPNVHVSDPDTIVSDITKANTKNSSIFSLALGNGADYKFLKKLSLQNSGFSRRIYEAADTALQLTDFYEEISSPLLADIEFEYTPDQIEDGTLTTRTFRRFFAGSGLVVAGKHHKEIDLFFKSDVTAVSITGSINFTFEAIFIIDPLPVKLNPSYMERLWAYLTIQQLLDEDAALDYDHNDKNKSSPQKKRALQLALEYSFVTPLTSLVVVKPNDSSNAVDPQDASQPSSSASYGGAHTSGGIGLPIYHGHGKSFSGLKQFEASLPQHYNPYYGKSYHDDDLEELEEMEETEEIPHVKPSLSYCTGDLDDITWLPNNHKITLTTAMKYEIEMQVAGKNMKNKVYSSCTTPKGEPGECRHLQYCVLNTFMHKKEDFIPYFCNIRNNVGVCCPAIQMENCNYLNIQRQNQLNQTLQ